MVRPGSAIDGRVRSLCGDTWLHRRGVGASSTTCEFHTGALFSGSSRRPAWCFTPRAGGGGGGGGGGWGGDALVILVGMVPPFRFAGLYEVTVARFREEIAAVARGVGSDGTDRRGNKFDRQAPVTSRAVALVRFGVATLSVWWPPRRRVGPLMRPIRVLRRC